MNATCHCLVNVNEPMGYFSDASVQPVDVICLFFRFSLRVFVELRLNLLEGLRNDELSLFVHPFRSMLKILSLSPSL